MKIKNLTPHALNVKKADGQYLTVEPSGSVARVNYETTLDRIQDGVEIFHFQYGEIKGLPPEQEGTILVVSGMVLAAINESTPGDPGDIFTRRDVFAPGYLIRDNDGRVVGCQGLRSS